ncbi:MAG: ROK family protein [Anderseniella sp.]|jgi:fructokinase|nr:ROK family protein [Anderseniella sp.]
MNRIAGRIGIDVGGTKIAGVVMDEAGRELETRRIPTPRGDYEGVVRAIAAMVDELAGAVGGSVTVGIGMPGSVSPLTGLVQNANSTWINSRPFQQDLEAATGQPVRLANDANCLALSEAFDGAGRGAGSVFGVILGTGCGGSLVVNGMLVEGRHSIGGEWGHNPLPWLQDCERPGPACWCGRHGCMETWVSGPALARDHLAATGEALDAEDIARRATAGDAGAKASLDRHLDRTGRGLAHVINIVDPHVIVIGGGLVDLPGLVERLPAAIAPHVFADAVDIQVRAAQHGPASGVRGAARLWDAPRTERSPS